MSFFSKAGVSPLKAKAYAALFVKNEIGNDTLEDLDKENLREMGVTALGDILRIIKHAKKVIETEARVDGMKEDDIKKEDLNEEDIDEVMARVEADIPKWRSEKSKVKRQETEGGHMDVDGPSLYGRRSKMIRKRALMEQEKISDAEAEVVEVKKEDIKKEAPTEEDTDEVMDIVESDIPKCRCKKSKVKRQETEKGGHMDVDGSSLYDRIKVTKRRAQVKQEDKVGAEEAMNSSKDVKPMIKPRKGAGKKCQICEKSFFSPQDMNKHVKAVHAGIKDWKCDKCPYAASQKVNLKSHINAVHDKIKDWTCDKCPYRASQKEHLKNHITAVHDKIRNFKCDKCSYASSQKQALESHISAVHDKIRDFKCNKCTYKASWKTNLNRHMRVMH